ncbi:MAG: tRNA 2-thiocytidine biosynthesis protein TtcA, partial [Hadesarchaea archaeon]|nr:tRNA 2-thiocytidine biosynthesis protein TtcA [Hadesarchaea archaeon]
MECSICSKEAIIRIKRKNKNYCKEHYRDYFLKEIKEILNNHDVTGRICVAVSGGKDSSTCLEALTHFNKLEVEPLHINLGIEDYSKKSLKSTRKLCEELDLGLNTVNLKKEYGAGTPEINQNERGKVCALCGTIKRYLMNKYAFENDFDYLATGHNLSDQVSSTFNNLANVYLTPFRGLKPVLKEMGEYKFAGRVKPLYFLSDKECLTYAESNDLPYYQGECPFSTDSPTDDLKEWLHELDSRK